MGKPLFQLVFGNIAENMKFISVHGIFIVGGHKDHQCVGQKLVNPLCQLHPGKSGHFNVKEQKVKTFAVLNVIEEILSACVS